MLSTRQLRRPLAALSSRASTWDDVSEVSPPAGPPTAAARNRELAALAQLPRLALGSPRLLRAPRASRAHLVIDVPGWRAPEGVAAPLRAYLRWLGYDARGWGLGINRGYPEADAPRLAEKVVRWADRHGPVTLIGWSLGGVIIREVAREHPDAVARVMTYGSPVVGGPTHTLGAPTYGEEECARIATLIEEHERARPLQVPVTAMFTRRDGIVDWRSCIDHYTPDIEHIEVGSTHVGLGFDPDVWRIIADRLARG